MRFSGASVVLVTSTGTLLVRADDNRRETMTKAKPASELPWEVVKEIVCWSPSDDELEEVAVCTKLAHCKADASYIAHAANAYPKLVEALKRIVSLTDGYPLLKAEMDIPLATDLLRELGEL
jgi:hypothetical protein